MFIYKVGKVEKHELVVGSSGLKMRVEFGYRCVITKYKSI